MKWLSNGMANFTWVQQEAIGGLKLNPVPER